MTRNLMIVESPAKAKTIEKFLGKDFVVKSCYGHIRDLQKQNFGIDIDKNYKPNYAIPADKEQVVKELKKLAKDAGEVWLATDEDREGEAISWHLCEVLGIVPEEAKRIVFHEITKKAIEDAVHNPRHVNIDLVNAQQARRILDRLVGFELSPLLWKKINMSSSLSAGRVQSVAVRLIVEREQEIMAFVPASSYKVFAYFTCTDAKGTQYSLKAELPGKIDRDSDAGEFLKQCTGANFSVSDISVKPSKRTPSAPFTTSTLQQEASNKLGYSVSRTMVIAQKLYEEGHITYMRTDSVHLSEQALDAAKKEIDRRYGKKYAQSRQFKTKISGAQEAHEAIRPTYMENEVIHAGHDEKRLYDLIWKRTMASQMADAELEKTTVNIEISTRPETLVAKGEVIRFDGFLKLYTETTEDDGEEGSSLLPPLKAGDDLTLTEMTATQKFTRPAARYTEASLVKKLEELGIGRPSTYAPTISTVQKRGYVEKKDKEGSDREYVQFTLKNKKIDKKVLHENTGAEKQKLFPTDLGILVTEFLIDNFPSILDYHFTANVEEQFDEIAVGKVEWQHMIDAFYKPFHEHLVKTEQTAQKVTGERYLGAYPGTGEPVKVMMGKFGPMVVMGDTKDKESTVKPRFAGLLKDQNMQTITLEEAIKLFELPKTIGTYRDDDLVIGIGRFGPYVRNANKFYSIPKNMEPLSVSAADAISIIEEKEKSDKERGPKVIKEFPEHEIQVLRGPYGPYVKKGKSNYRIPKDQVAENMSLEDILNLIENTQPTAKGKRRFNRAKK